MKIGFYFSHFETTDYGIASQAISLLLVATPTMGLAQPQEQSLTLSSHDNTELNLGYIEQLNKNYSQDELKDYMPQNLSKTDSEVNVAQKFGSTAVDQFMKVHKNDNSVTLTTIKKLDTNNQIGSSNFRYQLKVIEGKSAMTYNTSFFESSLGYSAFSETAQFEVSKKLDAQVKVMFTQSRDRDTSLSKISLAYEF